MAPSSDPAAAMMQRTKMAHLGMRQLEAIPASVFPVASVLVRLDLGFNRLHVIPEAIAQFTALEQLWANNNPIGEVHPAIAKCQRLKV
ncbi:unnamed protein product, partial [Phaeothamnion confervicola]